MVGSRTKHYIHCIYIIFTRANEASSDLTVTSSPQITMPKVWVVARHILEHNITRIIRSTSCRWIQPRLTSIYSKYYPYHCIQVNNGGRWGVVIRSKTRKCPAASRSTICSLDSILLVGTIHQNSNPLDPTPLLVSTNILGWS